MLAVFGKLWLLHIFSLNADAIRVSEDSENYENDIQTGSSGDCEDVSPDGCMTLTFMPGGVDEGCDKEYEGFGAIDDDPQARGTRINAGQCHAVSARVVPGRSLYKYPPLAYAGGVVIDGKRYPGCCPKTCGYCDELPGAVATSVPKPPPRPDPSGGGGGGGGPRPPTHRPIMSDPEPEPDPEELEFILEPEEEGIPPPRPRPDPIPDPTPAVDSMWCREWQDMGGQAHQMCSDEHNGQFFKEAQSPTGSRKRRKSEEHRMQIDGWCCWPSMPRFSGGSGACTTIPCYYPDGNFCDQDKTCPKMYNMTSMGIQELPGQRCSGKYPSRQEERARKQTCSPGS